MSGSPTGEAVSGATGALSAAPLVSVIVPARNASSHLVECLESIAGQTLRSIEVLVVDDGSTDATPDIARDFAARDARFRLLAGPASGSAGSARNVGIAAARGEFLAFPDADDVLAPTMLERLSAAAVRDGSDVVLADAEKFDEVTRMRAPLGGCLRRELLPPSPVDPETIRDVLFVITIPAAWNKIFRASLVREHGLRFQELPRVNDLCFTMLALAHARRLSVVDEPVITYRTGNAGSLQGTIDVSPLDFAAALDGVRAGLERAGLLTIHEWALRNLVAFTSIRALNRARAFAALRTIHAHVRGTLIPGYRLDELTPQHVFAEWALRDLAVVRRFGPRTWRLRQGITRIVRSVRRASQRDTAAPRLGS